MEPALDVIGRTLHNDPNARAFLERTSSIYVLDVTDPSNPKTYGCWNFIHQALNEVERYETARASKSSISPNNITEFNSHGYPSLVPHVRLLASMALRVARRSPQGDKAIVSTCISNASDYHCSASQSQWLFDLNMELREIVMGRIAAIAFDFSFHRNRGAVNPGAPATSSPASAFADHVVMDTFNAILAANAVAAGPTAIRHFATEWIIPSSRNIPVLALVSVAHHLALEGMRSASPAGTMDMLQQLSVPISSMVIVPALAEAATDNNSDEGEGERVHNSNTRILTKALMALEVWCGATTLTLPQVRHIAGKVNLNIVEILNDSMYSDSPPVVGALADFMDRAVDSPFETKAALSEDRMNQVRHIIQVNESAFKANFSPEQLRVIENKEMASILEDLSSSVGLQRIRFVERQNLGDVGVCRNLARIGRAVSSAWLEVHRGSGDDSHEPERGLIEFLLRTASHPCVSIAGMTLSVTSRFISKQNSLARELLPLLQRRAIIPHQVNPESGTLSLIRADQYGITIDEFFRFRESVVADALISCWEFDRDAYMDSCTSAIEEFCSENAQANLSFHLEAALFCIGSLGHLLAGIESKLVHVNQMNRCLAAISRKSKSVTANPLTVARLSLFLQNWSIWFKNSGKIAAAGDLSVTALSQALTLSGDPSAQAMAREVDISPVLEACEALKCIASASPEHFASENSMNGLMAIWQSLYSERRIGSVQRVPANSIEPMGRALCTIVTNTREDVRERAFTSLATPVIELIDQLVSSIRALSADDRQNIEVLSKSLAGELMILTALVESSVPVNDPESDDAEMSDDEDRAIQKCDPPSYAMVVVQRCWSNIGSISRDFSEQPDVSTSMSSLLSTLIPVQISTSNGSMILMRDMSSLSVAMLQKISASAPHNIHIFGHICSFLKEWAQIHGRAMSESEATPQDPELTLKQELTGLFRNALLELESKAQPYLGGQPWADPNSAKNSEESSQRQGQQAFESRAPMPKLEPSLGHYLGPLLSLLEEMTRTCPGLLMSAPSAASAALGRNSASAGDETLLRRVTSSAVPALIVDDMELVECSIRFLDAMCHCSRRNDATATAVRETLEHVRSGVLSRLLMGCCGRYEHSLLGAASRLFCSFVETFSNDVVGVESDLASALQQGFFQLGDDASRLVQHCLSRRCCPSNVARPAGGEPTWSCTELETFLEQVWDLHRSTDDVTALPTSDAVSRLLRAHAA